MKNGARKGPHKDVKSYHVTAIVEDALPGRVEALKAGVKVTGANGQAMVICPPVEAADATQRDADVRQPAIAMRSRA